MTAFLFNVGLAVISALLPGRAAGRLVRMRESGQITGPAVRINARRTRQTRGQAIA
jgi:hypothetical protein